MILSPANRSFNKDGRRGAWPPRSKQPYCGGTVVDNFRNPIVKVFERRKTVYKDFNRMIRSLNLTSQQRKVLEKLAEAGIKAGDNVICSQQFILGSTGDPGAAFKNPWSKTTDAWKNNGEILGFTFDKTHRNLSLIMKDEDAIVSFALSPHSRSTFLLKAEVCTPGKISLAFQNPSETNPIHSHVYGIDVVNFEKIVG